MTSAEIEAAKAAFLAKGGQIKAAPAGQAYGLDPVADKAKRVEAARAYSNAWNYEREAEIRFQRGVEEAGYFKS